MRTISNSEYKLYFIKITNKAYYMLIARKPQRNQSPSFTKLDSSPIKTDSSTPYWKLYYEGNNYPIDFKANYRSSHGKICGFWVR